MGLGIRDWLANGDLSCLVLHWLSLSLSLSLRSGFSLLLLCFRLFRPPYRSGRPRGSTPKGRRARMRDVFLRDMDVP
ncbi:conserved hypothetical protein [Xanthomonas citri pv. fuscans]|nr:conserved hypothetical protein [Xanthomonas citri pv. fuscans]SOO12995.1 conserved hypothetical protein [Xanthomonas citri pv. fuscans]SOO45644.1 conserved hypothetical protein [Xanthomonas citri pv. fuscans]